MVELQNYTRRKWPSCPINAIYALSLRVVVGIRMIIEDPVDSRVDAHFGKSSVETDQPPSASAAAPAGPFLASMGTCAGIHVLRFWLQPGLSVEALRINQRSARDPQSGLIDSISLEIRLQEGCPAKCAQAVIRVAQLSTVTKRLEHPPQVDIVTCLAEDTAAPAIGSALNHP